jgi:hypothetical protein
MAGADIDALNARVQQLQAELARLEVAAGHWADKAGSIGIGSGPGCMASPEGTAVSAAEALRAARAAGVELAVDCDDLVLEASAPPPPIDEAGEQSEPLSLYASIELRTAENQFAFQRQMNGG